MDGDRQGIQLVHLADPPQRLGAVPSIVARVALLAQRDAGEMLSLLDVMRVAGTRRVADAAWEGLHGCEVTALPWREIPAIHAASG